MTKTAKCTHYWQQKMNEKEKNTHMELFKVGI